MPKAPQTLKARLRRVMHAMGWTRSSQIAAAAGAFRPTVSRWLKEGQITMEPLFAYNLQNATGFSGWWIALGVGPERIADSSLPANQREELLRLANSVASMASSMVTILRQDRPGQTRGTSHSN